MGANPAVAGDLSMILIEMTGFTFELLDTVLDRCIGLVDTGYQANYMFSV